MRWISDFAPTSTPRVGSSRKITRGRTDSILAIATFCWLPPESDETGSWMPPRLRPRRSPSAVACAASFSASMVPQRVETWSRSSAEMLAAIERSRKTPVALAVLREVDDAVVDAVAVGADRQRLAVERDRRRWCPACSPQMPLTISLRPAPIRPAIPRISPRPRSKPTSRKRRPSPSPRTVEQRAGHPRLRRLLRRVELADHPADHVVDDEVRA